MNKDRYDIHPTDSEKTINLGLEIFLKQKCYEIQDFARNSY